MFRSFLTLISILVVLNSALAQVAWYEHRFFHELSEMTDIEFADIDGDGDEDVVTCETVYPDPRLSWWENVDGYGKTWENHIVTGHDNYVHRIELGDVDGDGDVDIIGEKYFVSDGVLWFDNLEGDGMSWDYHTLNDTDILIFDMQVGDMDNDGDLDVVETTLLNGLVWHENLHSDGSYWAVHEFAGHVGLHLTISDIDLDGDLDVFAGEDNFIWCENLNNAEHWTTHTLFENPNFDRVVVGDIDLDGDMDMLASSAIPTWYENLDGSCLLWQTHAIEDDNLTNTIHNILIDINNDGNLDVCMLAANYNLLKIYVNNNGLGTDWIEHDIDHYCVDNSGVRAVDIDQNGIQDIVTFDYWGKLRWHENQYPESGPWPDEYIAGGIFGPRGIVLEDLNQDGTKDLVCATEREYKIYWWDNIDGTGQHLERHFLDNQAGYVSSIDVGDLDSDGDPDVAGAGGNGSAGLVGWWDNLNGDATSWTRNVISEDHPGPNCVEIADIDSDEDLDIVLTSHYLKTLAWYENANGDASEWALHYVRRDYNYYTSVTSFDIDQDGDQDLLAAVGGDVSGKVSLYANVNGDGSSWCEIIVDNEILYATSVNVADIDEDGDFDLLVTSSLEGFSVYENTDGTNLNWDRHPIIGSDDSVWDGEAIDLDDDADIDIVGVLGSGEVVWYENLGGFDFMEWHITSELPFVKNICADDFDNDGDVDLFASSNQKKMIAWWEHGGFVSVNDMTNGGLDISPWFVSDAFPNPFNSTTIINVALPETSELKITISNVLGQTVGTLVNATTPAGYRSFTFDASYLSSGQYFVNVKVPGKLEESRKVTLVR